MSVIVFDTESNGNSDERICQLSYLIREGNAVQGKNFYFRVSSMSPYAMKVHGLSKYALENLSNGHVFADDAEEIDRDFASAELLVGHNVRSDVRRLRQELSRCCLPFKPRKIFCTMEFFNNAMQLTGVDKRRKYPKLSELCGYYRLQPESIQTLCAQLFHAEGISEHDARYDTAATYMAVLAAQRSGDLKGVF